MDWGLIAVVVAILIGLPLLAVRVSKAQRWDRLEATVVTNPEYELARELKLTWQERAQVDEACGKGLALEDPRLRRAVVEYSRLSLRAGTSGRVVCSRRSFS